MFLHKHFCIQKRKRFFCLMAVGGSPCLTHVRDKMKPKPLFPLPLTHLMNEVAIPAGCARGEGCFNYESKPRTADILYLIISLQKRQYITDL